jgi:hypothetical protein
VHRLVPFEGQRFHSNADEVPMLFCGILHAIV